MARVSNFGIASLLISLVLLYLDQGSDIWVVVNLYNSCHYQWFRTSLVLTLMPTIVMYLNWITVAINNPIETTDAGVMIVFVIFQPLVALIFTLKVIYKGDDDNEYLATLKFFKAAEVVFEAMGQLLFNVYVRSFLGPSDGINGYVQVASIILSYFAIIHGLGDKYASYYRSEYMPSIKNVFLSMCIIITDISLKLSIFALSLLINGVLTTVLWIIITFTIASAIVNIIVTKDYSELKALKLLDHSSGKKRFGPTGTGTKFNLFEMFFLAVTNLPNETTLKIKNIALRVQIQKIVTHFFIIIGLSAMTGILVVHQSYPTRFGSMNHINNEDSTTSTALNCKNLCDAKQAFINMQKALKNDNSLWPNLFTFDSDKFSGMNLSLIFEKLEVNKEAQKSIYDYISIKKDMNCSKLLLTSSHLLIWTGITWVLLAICLVQVICDYKKCGIFVKLHNMIISKENDSQEQTLAQ